jgi:hypothetical protein
MKKTLKVLALVAIAAAALIGCKKKEVVLHVGAPPNRTPRSLT